MQAEVITVNGRRYRKNPIDFNRYITETQAPASRQYKPVEEYDDEEEEAVETSNTMLNFEYEDDEIDCTITRLSTGELTTQMEVDPVFYKFIVGKNGAMKQKLQQDTGATIEIPTEGSMITIRGPTERSIVTARTRIEILVEQSMDLVDYNYFIAFPLNAPEFVSVVDNWQQEILCHPNCNKWGIDQDVLVPPPQMHLTILMLKLYGADAVERASQLLTSLQSRIYDLVGTTSVVVKMKGLEIMNDDPTSAHVLYAKLVRDSIAKAQQVADFIISHFEQEGFVTSERDRNAKLHATLLNTRYRAQKLQGQVGGVKKVERVPMNVSHLLKSYSNFNYGQVRIASVDLCQRGKTDSDGFYHRVASVKLP